MSAIKTFSGLAALMLLIAGCALTPVSVGMSRAQVLEQYGKPSRVLALPNGTRLQYSSQPAGQSVMVLDLDAADTVLAVRQMMTRAELLKIEPGTWTRERVESEFGPPASIDRVGSWSGDIMSYRWRDSMQDMFFWVYLDGNQVVQRTGQGMDIPMRPRLFGRD
ncbi:lipoprotein [Polaromonas sp.]|nr:lipoprotein [Polaromonas sp.]